MNTTPGEISESTTNPSDGLARSSCPVLRGAYIIRLPSQLAFMPRVSARRMPTTAKFRFAAWSRNVPSPYSMSSMRDIRSKLSSTPITHTMVCLPLYMASAWSFTHSDATSTSGSFLTFCSSGSSAGAVFPSAGTSSICGSKDVKNDATRSWKPLNTLSVTTRAIVATATPTALMQLMMFMACVLFFEKR